MLAMEEGASGSREQVSGTTSEGKFGMYSVPYRTGTIT